MTKLRRFMFSIAALGLCSCSDPASNSDTDGATAGQAATDTDGDGISDFDEVNKYGFDPTNDPHKFNPLIADVASVKVEFTSPPNIQIKYEYSDGTSETASTERSAGSSHTSTNSWQTSASVTVGASLEISADPKLTLSGSVTAGFAWTNEQAYENNSALTSAEGNESSNTVSSSESKIEITTKVTNTGHKAFTLQNLVLSGSNVDRTGTDILNSFGNLEYEGTAFPVTTLAPGESMTGLTFAATLYVDTTKEILRNSGGIFVAVAATEMTDPLTGDPINGQMTEIGAKTATILIDYDTYSGRDAEKFLVATNLTKGAPGVTLQTILERHLSIPFEVGTVSKKTGLKSLWGYGTSQAKHSNWVIARSYTEAGVSKQRICDITRNSCDLSAITVRAGDVVSFSYLIDKDGDGLSHGLEKAVGTNDSLVDSIPDDDFDTDLAWYLAGHPAPPTDGPSPVVSYQLSYVGNGHTGGLLPASPASFPEGQPVPVLDNPGGLEKINVNEASYRLAGWTTEPDGSGKTYNSRTPFTMATEDTILYAKWVPYAVGDKGPAGGYIYFIKDYYSDDWRYMEAAPKDQTAQAPWWGYTGAGVDLNDSTLNLKTVFGETIFTVMGSGKQNTEDIDSKDVTYGTAADICANLVVGRYHDWFLPSAQEFMVMATAQTSAGIPLGLNLKSNPVSTKWVGYWTSSLGTYPYVGIPTQTFGDTVLPVLVATNPTTNLPDFFVSVGDDNLAKLIWASSQIMDSALYGVRAVRRF